MFANNLIHKKWQPASADYLQSHAQQTCRRGLTMFRIETTILQRRQILVEIEKALEAAFFNSPFWTITSLSNIGHMSAAQSARCGHLFRGFYCPNYNQNLTRSERKHCNHDRWQYWLSGRGVIWRWWDMIGGNLPIVVLVGDAGTLRTGQSMANEREVKINFP